MRGGRVQAGGRVYVCVRDAQAWRKASYASFSGTTTFAPCAAIRTSSTFSSLT